MSNRPRISEPRRPGGPRWIGPEERCPTCKGPFETLRNAHGTPLHLCWRCEKASFDQNPYAKEQEEALRIAKDALAKAAEKDQ